MPRAVSRAQRSAATTDSKRVGRLDLVGVHHGGDALPDAGERDFSRAEGIDGDFVGGVENGGQGAAGQAGAAGEIERGEIGGARGFEFQFRQRGEIQRAQSALRRAAARSARIGSGSTCRSG